MAYDAQKTPTVARLKQTVEAIKKSLPTALSQLSNDSKFQTAAEVTAAIDAAIAKAKHASFKKVTALPEVSAAEENVFYLLLNAQTKHYDIYAKIQGDSGSYTLERLDDVTIDLSAYATTAATQALLDQKVDKETGKKLSTEDYTSAEKTKLAGLKNYTHPASSGGGSKTAGLYKIATDANGHVSSAAAVTKSDITTLGIPDKDTTYKAATQSVPGLMSGADKMKLDELQWATEEEIAEMLTEVLG